ncbi:hypothetical protein [Bradyrhizobium sp. RDI18]|uniref:hypothetical protein n=1 Tax=Bradyrhizobium sp. RDI18 TaxID=3367400 RepID=UPI0037223F90
MSNRLHRKVFATGQLTEFCSVNELEKQTGHPAEQWSLVLLKELVDNALDEAEKRCFGRDPARSERPRVKKLAQIGASTAERTRLYDQPDRHSRSTSHRSCHDVAGLAAKARQKWPLVGQGVTR